MDVQNVLGDSGAEAASQPAHCDVEDMTGIFFRWILIQ